MKFIEFNPEERLYCTIAAAVLGAGALSAGAGIWGASTAANAQTSAAQASIVNQQQMYANNKNVLSPFINAGSGAIGQLQNWTDPTSTTNPLSSLLKLVTPGADQSAALAQMPGYQFDVQQGTRAAQNALAARGLGGSPGAIAKGVGGYVTGLANNTWSSEVQNLLSTFGAEGGALQNLVNTGAQSGNALAGVGTNTANSISSSLTGAGSAQAAGANATGAAIGGLGSNITTAALLQQLTGGGGGSIYQNPGAAIPGAYGPTSAGGPMGPTPLFS